MGNENTDRYRAIFVDCFDTLVLRHTTAATVVERWAKCIQRKFTGLAEIPVSTLSGLRRQKFQELRERLLDNKSERTEVTYEEALTSLYEEISDLMEGTQATEFVSASRMIDISVEIGCAYINSKLLKELLQEKKGGKRLFILSDYYLPAEDIRKILFSVGVPDDLFEQLFISCDIGRRKANGDAYSYVLDALGLKPQEVKMIGDNRTSDLKIPASIGIRTDYRANTIHKARIHAADKLKLSFSKRQKRQAVNEMYRTGMDYSEYIYMFYLFTKRLYHRLRLDHVSTIAFMAREGYYLQNLFELYQSIMIPKEDHVHSSYYWCSRRSVMSGIRSALLPESMDEPISLRNWLKSLDISVDDAKTYLSFTDAEAEIPVKLQDSALYRGLMENDAFREKFEAIIRDNHRAFLQYTGPYLDKGIFRFVDSGWKCTTQNAIQKYYGIDTEAYYIGVQKADKPILDLKRTGLIFCEEKPRSKYYDYLGTNIPFYQQLLAAPHGTALKYLYDGEGVTVKSEWDPMEESLYHQKIERLQQYMQLKFMGLCVWDDRDAFDPKEDWFLAKSSMRSSLFAKGTRLRFIRECTDNYVQNFQQENRGKVKYDPSKVRLSPDIIWSPEKYMRYISKIQRTSLYDKKAVQLFYPTVARLYYGYTLLVHCIKGMKR